MAHDIAVESQQEIENENLWEGGVEPFKASYGKLMMWYFLLSDAFTFAGFLIAYGALRFSNDAWPVPDFVFKTTPGVLGGFENAPLMFVTFMTFVLIVSSVTVLRAVQEGKLENTNGVVKWMVVTVLGGGVFLGCQAWEWTNLIAVEGMPIYNNPFSVHQEGGTYLTLDELRAHAAKKGWEEKSYEMTDHKTGATESVAYFVDNAKTEKNIFVEKRDHHGHKPASNAFEAEDNYLITFNHDLHDYGIAMYKDANGVVKSESFGPQAFGALFFFITGFHGFHVFTGLIFLAIIAMNTASNFYRPRNNGHEMVEKVGLYWHFVDLVWVFVFLVFYLI